MSSLYAPIKLVPWSDVIEVHLSCRKIEFLNAAINGFNSSTDKNVNISFEGISTAMSVCQN